MTISVLIVDDQELLREGFRLILEKSGFNVVGEASDGVEAIERARALSPDVVLMDIRMPRLDGIEATRRIVTHRPATRVLVLTTFDLDEYVYDAVRAGASGFVLKDLRPADLVRAVEIVSVGEAMLAPQVTRRLLEQFAPAPSQTAAMPALTERETEVLRLIATGRSNNEIADQLYLSEATVKTYVSRLLTKVGRRDRVQLAVLAYESGLVRPGTG
ncbi:response regulator transcription factor [Kocuria carniphila]|uniref:response regulator n=1 Tax=Kocuria carniphila TaxID=262208 RepID=UPI00101BF971|nr:response regulator transcription factor [Kocuria carniphila]